MLKPIYFILMCTFISQAQTIGLIQHESNSLDNGYVLFAPLKSKTTYLIDKCGKQVHNWNSSYEPEQSVYLLSDGTLLRPGKANNTTFTAGGNGGVIEKIDWNGNVTWSYTISDNIKCQHHDIKALPNGNILILAWEKKTITEATDQGRNPNLIGSSVWSEQIIELQPVGNNSANIVWEWHLWDHLVQEYDNTKSNYKTVSQHPELININYNATTNEDWIHLNAIDYNSDLDQILISAHGFGEIWIIDHSTTTAEATGHAGGNSNHGGDLLERWGNPLAYNNGTQNNRKLWGQHNVYWIENNYPYANEIMIFNNGNGRTGGNYSTVEIIQTPVNGYQYTSTLPYAPTATSWMYNNNNSNNFYAQNISGAQQLSNGNVLICNGTNGTFTEVITDGTTVWKYINPVANSGIMTQGTTPSANLVFRCTFYPSEYSGFNNHTLVSGSTIENSNSATSSCNINLNNTIKNSLMNVKINIDHHLHKLYITLTENTKITLSIYNLLGQKMFENNYNNNQISIDTNTLKNEVYILKINSEGFKFIP